MNRVMLHDIGSRAELQALQLDKARCLLQRALGNKFFAPRLAGTKLRPESLRDLSQWRDLPTFDKLDVLADQTADPPFGARLGVDRSEIREVHLTSGTSGIGQEAMGLTEDDVHTAGYTWEPTFRSMGLVPGDAFVTFYPVSFLTYGRIVLEGGRRMGVPVIPLAGVDRSVALSMMRRLQPAGIGARPALFRLIAEDLAADGLRPRDVLPGMKGLLCSGISPATALQEEEDWGATVHELYGSSQAAGIAAVTGRRGAVPDGLPGVMRCLEHHYLVEAVDPDSLEPVEEGEAELLLTCLDRVASPFIRYRTRDRVEVVPPGSYESDLALLGIRVGTVGRWDDMLKIRGNNVWPSQLDEALLGHPAVMDYRAEVVLDHRGVDVMTVTVRTSAEFAARKQLVVDLRSRVKVATNVSPTVGFDPAMPPPALKPQRLIDRRTS